jgi:protein gp37
MGNTKYTGPVRLIKNELETRLVTPDGKIIFVQSCGDLFASDVKAEWINMILGRIAQFPKQRFLVQSKNPGRFADFVIPPNCILGTTLESNINYELSHAPIPARRFECLLRVKGCHDVMVSVEPVLCFDLEVFVSWFKALSPLFVSVGADSGGNCLNEPSMGELLALIQRLNGFTEVRLKDNLNRLLSGHWNTTLTK